MSQSSHTLPAVRRARWRHLLAGVRDVSPILPGIVPFAMISGAVAVEAGIPPALAMAMSVVIFAGAAQLAAVQLIGAGATIPVVVMTVWIINLRFVMYSASLSGHLKHLLRRWGIPLAYLLTDQAYAVSIHRFTSGHKAGRGSYFLGAGSTLWVTWQVCTAAGIVLGNRVPESWGLDFAVPLSFLALAIAAVRDRATASAALVAGAVAVLGMSLPFNLGLVGAIVLGIASGLAVEAWRGAGAGSDGRGTGKDGSDG